MQGGCFITESCAWSVFGGSLSPVWLMKLIA
jgi:hypothetical protein